MREITTHIGTDQAPRHILSHIDGFHAAVISEYQMEFI